jgi:prolyl-tRNA synthetase
MMGGLEAHEYMYLTPIGEDTLLFCNTCDYAANRQVAAFRKPDPPREEAPAAGKSPHTGNLHDLLTWQLTWIFPHPGRPKRYSMVAELQGADACVWCLLCCAGIWL